MSETKPPIPSEKPPVEIKEIPVADKSVEKAPPLDGFVKLGAVPSNAEGLPPVPARPKPFPWPILLAILTPFAVAGALMAPWQQQDHILLLRIGWISLSAVLPGLSLMAVLGGFWQIRRRPVFSSLAILLAGSMTGLCLWLAQRIAESNWIE